MENIWQDTKPSEVKALVSHFARARDRLPSPLRGLWIKREIVERMSICGRCHDQWSDILEFEPERAFELDPPIYVTEEMYDDRFGRETGFWMSPQPRSWV